MIKRWISGLRFPSLVMLGCFLLAMNLLIPDPLPWVDEILLAIVAAALANLRKDAPEPSTDPSSNSPSNPGPDPEPDRTSDLGPGEGSGPGSESR